MMRIRFTKRYSTILLIWYRSVSAANSALKVLNDFYWSSDENTTEKCLIRKLALKKLLSQCVKLIFNVTKTHLESIGLSEVRKNYFLMLK